MSNQEVDIWMPVYIGDMLAKTTRMTTEQIGASFLVLMDYWRNGAIPNDNNIIASITRLSLSKAKALKDVLIRANLLNVYDEEIRSEYLDNLKTQAESNKTAKAERAKKAAEARWNKSQDNVNTEHNSSNTNASNKHDLSNANAYPQAMPKQCINDAKSMLEECPSSSPSSINNISITHEQNLHDENSKGDDRFLFDLDTVNTRIKLRGLKEITQEDLSRLQQDLQDEYGHRNQMVKNQVLGKLVQWVERRQQTPLTPPEKPNVKTKQSTTRSTGLNVNDAWKDQPMNDQPFYGTVELPEGME